jgi:hypothetical protein
VSCENLGKFDDKIFASLSDEPKTPNEIAVELNINQRTAQSVLFQLALSKSDVIGYKKVGRIHLFWRKH